MKFKDHLACAALTLGAFFVTAGLVTKPGDVDCCAAAVAPPAVVAEPLLEQARAARRALASVASVTR